MRNFYQKLVDLRFNMVDYSRTIGLCDNFKIENGTGPNKKRYLKQSAHITPVVILLVFAMDM